jgi:hypothetical protein
LASVKDDPDANRIAGMQFRVVMAGLAVVTRGASLFDIVDRTIMTPVRDVGARSLFSATAKRGRGTTGAREASEPWWRGRGTRRFVVGARDDSDEVASVARGRETSKLEIGVLWRRLRCVAACAPSTTLLRRVVPLPRYRGGG